MNVAERVARLEFQARYFNVPLANVIRQARACADSIAADIAKMERTGKTTLRGFTLEQNRAKYAEMLETIAAAESKP